MVRGLGILFAIVAGVFVAALLWGPVGALGTYIVFSLDALTAGDRLPVIAPLLWAFWGAVCGLFVGLYIRAERLGWERRRPLLLVAPLCLMLVVAALVHL
jgi:hypothetical protein